jgi:hypothetical protein
VDVVTELTYLLVAALPAGVPGAAGFEKYFLRPAGGRVEFESPGPDLDRLWKEAKGRPVVEEHQISAVGRVRPVYFVGPPDRLAFAAPLMPGWLDAGAPSKVRVWFLESFLDADELNLLTPTFQPVAWWALSTCFMFTLDRDHADQLNAAIEEETATGASFGPLRR